MVDRLAEEVVGVKYFVQFEVASAGHPGEDMVDKVLDDRMNPRITQVVTET